MVPFELEDNRQGEMEAGGRRSVVMFQEGKGKYVICWVSTKVRWYERDFFFFITGMYGLRVFSVVDWGLRFMPVVLKEISHRKIMPEQKIARYGVENLP